MGVNESKVQALNLACLSLSPCLLVLDLAAESDSREKGATKPGANQEKAFRKPRVYPRRTAHLKIIEPNLNAIDQIALASNSRLSGTPTPSVRPYPQGIGNQDTPIN
jgi:hypothetical protein